MRRLVALVAVVLLVAGCTSLPTSGPVHTAEPQIPAGYGVDVLAEGPAANASPEEIVQGFLRASAYGHTDDFQVALQYLAPGTEWDPLAAVHVFSADSSPELTTREDGGISVSVEEIASVDELGRYRIVGETPLESTFSLVRDTRNQWRIAALPPGLIVSDLNFQQTFSVAPIHFLTHDFLATVPEQRWYPRESRVEHLVEGLLAGPSGWMEFGVVSAFPPGVELLDVTTTDGDASITLSDQFTDASPQEIALAYAQLEATFADVPDVRSVQIEVNGALVPKPDFEVELSLPPVVSGPVLLANGQVQRYSAGALQALEGATDLTQREPRHPGVPYADSEEPVVVLVEGNSAVLTAPEDGAEPVVIFTGTNLTPPSYDRYGWIWVAEHTNQGVLTTIRTDGTSSVLGASWLTGRVVTHVQVAADGARAVVVSRDEATAYVELVGISRDNLGRPRAVGEPLLIAESLTSVLDIAWVDQTSLVLLGSTTPEAEVRVHRVQIGGPMTVLPVVDGATALASNRSERSVVVATEDGNLFVRSGAGWRSVVGGIQDPTFSG